MKTFKQYTEGLGDTEMTGGPEENPAPNQPTVSDVSATLRKIEMVNKEERGKYNGLLTIIRSKPGMLGLFAELISSLAGTKVSTGQRITNRL